MAKIHTYLNFNGNCKEAFAFYQTVFKTDSLETYYYGDMPKDPNQPAIPEDAKGKVMHSSLYLNQESKLMGYDILPNSSTENETYTNSSTQKVENLSYIMLDTDSAQEAHDLFSSLTENAKLIEMKLEETFFAELFSSFQDQFGVYWMIHFEGNKKMD